MTYPSSSQAKWLPARGGATWGGQIEKKKFWGAKIRKNNKIWGKILIFFKFF